MGKTQKKNSKGRLDRYYYLAKEKGYRARSSFKIIQINEKYGHFLEKSKVVIDLCAAPGSWCQVASRLCPINSLIVGVDIVPIKPLPNCITFQSDITTEDCRSKLRGHLKTWKADTVLHDGAPNVGMGWVQDAFTQSQLVLKALKLAAEHLTQGGTFVTKIFRSKDYNHLIWIFQQLFAKVEATKPPSSRNVSAEIFVVCQGFKAPKKLDPRLLDPKEVFEEVGPVNTNEEAKVYDPAKKVRKREGYEEGDYLLYHEMSLLDFVKCEEPIKALGGHNKLVEPEKSDPEWKIARKTKHCTPELLECIKDLKVLGKSDFRLILKFRIEARGVLGLEDEEEGEGDVQVEAITEDERINKELDQLTEKEKQKRKREKKRMNELKQKEIRRAQLNMMSDMSIGEDSVRMGKDSMFSLKTANRTGIVDDLARGKKSMIPVDEDSKAKEQMASESDVDSDVEVDDLEAQLDTMYESFKQMKAEESSRYKAKLERGDVDDEEWDGIEDSKKSDEESDAEYEMQDDSDDSDNDESINEIMRMKKQKDLSQQASMFYATNSVFDDLNDEDLLDAMVTKDTAVTSQAQKKRKAEELSEPEIDIVKNAPAVESDSDIDSDGESVSRQLKRAKSERERVEINTVEAMTLAHQVALGQMTRNDLVNEGINKFSFRDTENLPEWFIEDEKEHTKVYKPITKEAAAAMKQKIKELNARPIKKVLEAQGRKKMRALRRLEKLKKKSDLINDDSEKSERDKAEEISRLARRLTKKQKVKPKITLVVASGKNKGLSGRPKGVKGKYKMVDGVLKNEQRALKRIAKKKKK